MMPNGLAETIGANVILMGGAAWAFVRFAIGLERKYGERIEIEREEISKRLDDAENEIISLRDMLNKEREAYFLHRLECLEIKRDLVELQARLGIQKEDDK